MDIPVLLFLVSCSANLLFCEEEPVSHFVYSDMPACLAARQKALSESAAPSGRVTLAKCRYDPAVARGGRAHPMANPLMN